MSQEIVPTPPTTSAPELKSQSRKSLGEFFAQKSIKRLGGVLVPGILAAILAPIFAPGAGVLGAVAVHNGLKLLNIPLSDKTVEKLMQGKAPTEADLVETLESLLVKDPEVNKETAQVLINHMPEIKAASQENQQLETTWLATNLEANLTQQGATLEKIASKIGSLVSLEGTEFEAALAALSQSLPSITQTVSAQDDSKISDIEQSAQNTKVKVTQEVSAKGRSSIKGVKQQSG